MSTPPPYPAATPSRLITIISWSMILFTAGLLAPGFITDPTFFCVPGLLATILLICWLKTPMSFDWHGDDLVVHYRWGSKQRGPVERCLQLDKELKGVWRLCGNGGLFAMTGLYWSKDLGKFHAYVTNHKREKIVVVDRFGSRSLVSPEDPEAFMRACPKP